MDGGLCCHHLGIVFSGSFFLVPFCVARAIPLKVAPVFVCSPTWLNISFFTPPGPLDELKDVLQFVE